MLGHNSIRGNLLLGLTSFYNMTLTLSDRCYVIVSPRDWYDRGLVTWCGCHSPNFFMIQDDLVFSFRISWRWKASYLLQGFVLLQVLPREYFVVTVPLPVPVGKGEHKICLWWFGTDFQQKTCQVDYSCRASESMEISKLKVHVRVSVKTNWIDFLRLERMDVNANILTRESEKRQVDQTKKLTKSSSSVK